MSIIKLERDLGEQAKDDFWQDLLPEIKHYRFLLYAAPLPINSHADKLISSLHEKLRICRNLFPSFVSPVHDIAEQLSIMSKLYDNPLLEAIEKLIPEDEQRFVALLLKEPYLFPLTEDVLEMHPAGKRIELVNQYQLREERCYHRLLVVGPSYWYPEYVLRSPRAPEIHLLSYSWVMDKWKPQPVFVQPFNQQKTRGVKQYIEDKYVVDHGEPDEVSKYEERDIISEINWKQVSTKIIRQTQDDHNQEFVPARLYLLADNHAVFLEESGHTSVMILDLDTGLEDDDENENDEQSIMRISTSKLRPGMYLLLRTEGGGDYIVPIADWLLQAHASTFRKKQAHWKTLLRKLVEAKGALQVSLDLINWGSDRANEINVRNWMSIRSIHPNDDKDFLAILRLVGLQDKAQEYLDTAKQIESAHRKAGFHIRKLLLRQVEKADLGELHRQGYMDFELSEVDGGSLTAFRIEHISPEVSNIPVSRIGRPIAIKDLLWHQ